MNSKYFSPLFCVVLFLVFRAGAVAATATPSFSTGTGTYHTPQSVKISDATSGIKIYYTANGSTPTTGSSVYSSAITISATTTLKAIAVVSGTSSAVASAVYTISPAMTPSFSTGTGTYHTPPTVKISDGTTGAVIYYTTNGSSPTTASAVYSSPLTISVTTTLKAIAVCPGGPWSSTDTAVYTMTGAVTPTFSTGTGTYHVPQSVKISDGTSGAVIYYTINGSNPTTSSAVYSSPITIATTTTLKAIAVYPGGPWSSTDTAVYTVVAPATPTISVASGTYERSVSSAISDSSSGAVVHYTTDGSTPTTASAVYGGPISFSNSSSFSTTRTLRAIATYPGGMSTAAVTATYTILSATTPIHGITSSASFLGMNVNGLLDGTPWPEVQVGALRVLGLETNWATANPSRGVFKWTSLDQKINLAHNNGAELLYTFSGTPPWAIPTGLKITSIARKSGVVTVTTSVAHNLYFNPTYLATQQSSITVAGVTDKSFDGTFLITGSPTATTLTFSQGGSDGSSSAGTLSAVCGGGDAPTECAEAPGSISNWDWYVYDLINHVGPGVIRYWELWNEANITQSWHGDPKMLVQMAADAKGIIKSIDPNAIILSPSTTINFETPAECANYDPRCGSKWLNNWLAAGGKNYIDGVAFHGYPQMGESPEVIQGSVTLLQIAMDDNGVGSLPLYDTESSWGLNTALPAQSDQIAFLGRHLLMEQSMGVQGSFWFSYDASTWGTLWSSTTGLTEVGIADQQIGKWIEGNGVTHPCAPSASDATTYTCGYSRANGYVAMAVWNTVGTKSFTVPAGYVQYRELNGDVVSSAAGSSISISKTPILIENRSAF